MSAMIRPNTTAPASAHIPVTRSTASLPLGLSASAAGALARVAEAGEVLHTPVEQGADDDAGQRNAHGLVLSLSGQCPPDEYQQNQRARRDAGCVQADSTPRAGRGDPPGLLGDRARSLGYPGRGGDGGAVVAAVQGTDHASREAGAHLHASHGC